MSKDARRAVRIAIIGGGFSGSSVLANLVEHVAPGTAIELFDARGAFAAGDAYATEDPRHLLNVAAGRMGAFAAGDFVAWLNTAEGSAVAARYCFGRTPGAADFLPRALYGHYLAHILNCSVSIARERDIAVSLNASAVTDIRKRGTLLDVRTARGWQTKFDAVVLATGNFAPPAPCRINRSIRTSPDYVADLWHPPGKSIFPGDATRLSRKDTVLIIGSGLTAVDAVLTLDRVGFEGRIVAVSRHGRIPAAQLSVPAAPWSFRVSPGSVAPTALAIVNWLKTEARFAAQAGKDWRSVFEALRPVTRRLWRELDASEQKRLLRRYSLWSIHRHRMAPEAAEQIAALRQSGRLALMAGTVVSLRRRFGRFRVRIRRQTGDAVLRPRLVLNCTGPNFDVGANGSALFHNLLKRGLVFRSENGLGLAINPQGAVRGAAEGQIFAIGNLLFGDCLECTAVPELRETARWIGGQIASMGCAGYGAAPEPKAFHLLAG